MSSFAGAKTTSRRFSLMNGASLPLAIALGTTLCGGALLAGPLHAAPTVGSDENGPQVQILSPSYQDVIKGSFSISVGITAKNYNPEFIELLVDDRLATEGPVPLSLFGNTGNTPAAFQWDTRTFTDGPHKLTVRVTDKQGFRGWAEVNIFINNNRAVDTLPPSLLWQNLENFASISGRAQIQLDAKDNFGVKMLMVTINPANSPNQKPAVGTWLFNRPPYVVNFDSTRVKDGLYTLKANAWDAMDQQGEATQLTVGVINNPINARSIGESLQGLQSFENAVANARPNRPAAQLPSGVNPKAQTVVGLEKLNPNLKVATPKAEAKVPTAQNFASASKPREGALAGQTNNAQAVKAPPRVANLAPSLPQFGVRSVPQVLKPQVVAPKVAVKTVVPPATPVKIAKVEVPEQVETLAEPQLSTFSRKAEPLATRELSPIETGVSSDSNPRLAMLDTSELSLREDVSLNQSAVEVDAPSLSKLVEVERTTRVSALETQISAEEGDIEGRLSVPAIETRFVADASNAKIEVAALPSSQEREALVAEFATLSQTSTQPSLALSVSPEIAPAKVRAEVTRVGLAPKPVAPQLSAPTPRIAPEKVATLSSETSPKLSVASVATPKVNIGKIAIGTVRGGLSKVIRKPIASTPKIEVPKTVLAALPRGEKAATSSRKASITVAPIQVSAFKDMPSVHRVERTTTLRAVAARYGLPVELVAACNVWPVEMNVVKGMTVKLPRPLQVSYNGAPVDSDAQSMLVGDSAVTAFRFMFEKSGGTMKWDAKNQRVVAKKGETEISLTIGSKVAKVGDQKVMMELAAFLFEGRTMVPVRLFEEGLRAEIEWDPQTGRMVVAMINPTASGAVLNG